VSVAAAPPSAADRARITGKMVRRIRSRLKLTQAELAALLGVSAQSVYQWERKGGPLTFRRDTKAKLVAVRDMGIHEAKRALGAAAAGSAGSASASSSPSRKESGARKSGAKKKAASTKKSPARRKGSTAKKRSAGKKRTARKK
jgi:DNA-binding XRE family transcriptional regulator